MKDYKGDFVVIEDVLDKNKTREELKLEFDEAKRKSDELERGRIFYRVSTPLQIFFAVMLIAFTILVSIAVMYVYSIDLKITIENVTIAKIREVEIFSWMYNNLTIYLAINISIIVIMLIFSLFGNLKKVGNITIYATFKRFELISYSFLIFSGAAIFFYKPIVSLYLSLAIMGDNFEFNDSGADSLVENFVVYLYSSFTFIIALLPLIFVMAVFGGIVSYQNTSNLKLRSYQESKTERDSIIDRNKYKKHLHTKYFLYKTFIVVNSIVILILPLTIAYSSTNLVLNKCEIYGKFYEAQKTESSESKDKNYSGEAKTSSVDSEKPPWPLSLIVDFNAKLEKASNIMDAFKYVTDEELQTSCNIIPQSNLSPIPSAEQSNPATEPSTPPVEPKKATPETKPSFSP